jgi:hypothetical protein
MPDNADLRRVIVSIHGIRSEGLWQEDFEKVFKHHFRFLRFKYGEFRHPIGAVLWIALELWVVLGGAVALLVAWRLDVLYGWRDWIIALSTWLLLGFIANFLADIRRKRVVNKFVAWIDSEVQNELNPHIIAHSLGSFVLGRLLHNYPERDFKHIILMGCVLKRRYAWQEMSSRFDMVRNEVAGRDWVSRLSTFLNPIIPEMGAAGIRGFSSIPGFVRTLNENDFGSPWRPCVDDCSCGFGKIDSPAARILNVWCAKLGHNDMARHRARLVWLPFLWDIPPRVHREFIEICQECFVLEKEKRRSELTAKANYLRKRCWFWTRGSLESFIETRLREELWTDGSPTPELVTIAVRQLWHAVTRAALHNAPPSDEIYLYPTMAVDVAIASAIASLQYKTIAGT